MKEIRFIFPMDHFCMIDSCAGLVIMIDVAIEKKKR
jgi:hypothetical protein